MTKKVLLLGGTGAIGLYLAPELVSRGYEVYITTRENRESGNKKIQYIKGNARSIEFTEKTLNARDYDAVVDFMVYATNEFRARQKLLLEHTHHYIFLSTYRVFAEAQVITEKTPRLLDVSQDKEFLATDDYSLAKARQEDMLRNAKSNNWTIVRPSITYSRDRFQLGTLEADVVLWRTLQGMPVVLPREMLRKKTTMTWAGDVAKLIGCLVLNEKALGEDFNVVTSEHHTWLEVANIYTDSVGLKVKSVGLAQYVEALGGGSNWYQVNYDRMFDRVMDNSKVLRVTGIKQEDFISLEAGLKRELTEFVKNPNFAGIDYAKQAKIDRLTRTRVHLRSASVNDRRVYLESRHPTTMKLVNMAHKARPRTRLMALKSKLRPRTRYRNLRRSYRSRVAQNNYKNADGAILTLTGYFNYGNIIQRYALQEFLRQKKLKFVSYAGEPQDVAGPEFDRYRATIAFVDKRIWRKSFDPKDKFKTYIVGSDQVWRNWGYQDEVNELGYYFLNFVQSHNPRRIAYAVSFGQDNLKDAMVSNNFVKYSAPLVNKFDAISVREKSGAEIMRKTWGIKSQQVLDPTMLLTATDYSSIVKKASNKLETAGLIFAYILGLNKTKASVITKVEQALGKQAKVVDLYKIDPLPAVEQWLKEFRDTDFVITDSFHGTVFSIINNKPFVVVDNADGGVARIVSLLKMVGLEDRYIRNAHSGKFDLGNLREINWSSVNNKIAEQREQSAKWLTIALSGRS